MNPLEQYKQDVKDILQSLDCWGDETEIAKFVGALLEYLRVREEEIERCGSKRPLRKVLCQLAKGHNGSHQAVIYWEGVEK